MSLKMSQLVEKSQTPKSTILYYIKEGLLPEPIKVKPNVHRYPEDFVERIRFIKYLQHHFHASIDQIRALMGQEGFDPSRGFESVLRTLDLLTAPAEGARYDDAAFCEKLAVDCDTLERWLETGAIFRRDGDFSDKEVEIGRILKALEEAGVEEKLVGSYVAHARAVADTEVAVAHALLKNGGDRNATLKTLFDATLILKPYLFDMHLVAAYRQKSGEES